MYALIFFELKEEGKTPTMFLLREQNMYIVYNKSMYRKLKCYKEASQADMSPCREGYTSVVSNFMHCFRSGFARGRAKVEAWGMCWHS
jgi:hypothetical protein